MVKDFVGCCYTISQEFHRGCGVHIFIHLVDSSLIFN